MVITFNIIIIIMIDQEQTSQQDARMSQRQPAPSLTTHHLVTVDGDLSYHRSVTTEIMIFISIMMRMVFRLQFKFLHIFRERWGSDGSLPLTPTGTGISWPTWDRLYFCCMRNIICHQNSSQPHDNDQEWHRRDRGEGRVHLHRLLRQQLQRAADDDQGRGLWQVDFDVDPNKIMTMIQRSAEDQHCVHQILLCFETVLTTHLIRWEVLGDSAEFMHMDEDIESLQCVCRMWSDGPSCLSD